MCKLYLSWLFPVRWTFNLQCNHFGPSALGQIKPQKTTTTKQSKTDREREKNQCFHVTLTLKICIFFKRTSVYLKDTTWSLEQKRNVSDGNCTATSWVKFTCVFLFFNFLLQTHLYQIRYEKQNMLYMCYIWNIGSRFKKTKNKTIIKWAKNLFAHCYIICCFWGDLKWNECQNVIV